MAEENPNQVDVSAKAIEALIEVMKAATTPEMLQAQQILLRRLAVTGDVVPSRLPAPANITEVGGYINLLDTLDQPELRAQLLASALGVAGPNPPLGFFPVSPMLFFSARKNDRPAGPQQAAIPTHYTLRSDFASAFDEAVKKIHDRGCASPFLSSVGALPPFTAQLTSSDDLLRYIGRSLDMVPSAALHDPEADPLALARLTTSGDFEVIARQVDASAPDAALVVEEDWTALKCDATSCAEITGNRKYLPLTPILNEAGWHQLAPLSLPNSLAQPGNWHHWVNVTGLVAGVTVYGDELRLVRTEAEIAASALREYLSYVWNGTAFEG